MKEQRENKREKRILTAVCLSLGLVFVFSLWLLLRMYGNRREDIGRYAKIYQDGNLIKTVSLEKENMFLVEGERGAYNRIQVKDGAIGVTEASCPDFLCGKMGFLKYGPIPITCLPNGLVIEICQEKDLDDLEEIDGMAY